ncbi:hypothetical protein QT995_26900 [Microcoleus sp. S36b_A3]|uniref:hypothetical protein n=1 Tax=unclassified Microcoleus TaxID=2642155 RepID=UPI002FCF426E
MSNKVQYDEDFGLDLNQVVAWKRIPTYLGPALRDRKDWDLELYLSGNTILVEKSSLGEEAFNNLLQDLSNEFPPNSSKDGLLEKAFG